MQSFIAQRAAYIQEHEGFLTELLPISERILAGETLSESDTASFKELLGKFQRHRELFAKFRTNFRLSVYFPQFKAQRSVQDEVEAQRRRERRERVLAARDAFQKRTNTFVALSEATGDVFNHIDSNIDDLALHQLRYVRDLEVIAQTEPLGFSPAHFMEKCAHFDDNYSKALQLSQATPQQSRIALRPSVQKLQVQKTPQHRAPPQRFERAHERRLQELIENSKARLTYEQIAQIINNEFGTTFSGKQCQQKWTRCLDPNLSKGAWTEQEDAWLLELWKEHQGDYKLIGELMHRNPPQIKARRQILQRRGEL